jgi:hypothetical protein
MELYNELYKDILAVLTKNLDIEYTDPKPWKPSEIKPKDELSLVSISQMCASKIFYNMEYSPEIEDYLENKILPILEKHYNI